MTVACDENRKSHARQGLTIATGTRILTVDWGTNNTWPTNYVEASTFSVFVADGTTGTPPSANVILAIVEDAVDPAGNFVTATGGSTLSTGVLAVLDLGSNPTTNTSFTIGNGLNGAGASDSRNAALSKFGTFRLVISTGNSLNAALRVADGGGAGAFHQDSDGNTASGAGNLIGNTGVRIDGVGGVKCKLTTATRTSGNWGYGTGTITASFTFKSAIDGTSAPYTNAALKDMRVCWSTESSPSSSIVKKTSGTLSSAGVLSIGATNIDTDWGQVVAGSSFFTEVAVGQNFGDASTPAGEKAAIYAVGTSDAADNEKMAYVYQNTTQATGYTNSTDTNRRIRTSTADQLASSAIQAFTTSALSTTGVGVFSSSGRTTTQTVFKRTGPTVTTNAIPFLRVFLADAYTVAIPNATSFILTARTPTGAPDNDTSENSQTLTTGSGTGNIDWSYTIANNHAAFNRFFKTGATRVTGSHVSTGPDDADNPPLRLTVTTVSTTVATASSASATNLVVASASSFQPGDVYKGGDQVRINRGGAHDEYARITNIDSSQTTLTFASGLTFAHSVGETVELAVAVYGKDILATGNRFAGTKEPTVRTTSVYGVSSSIIWEDIWTGSSATVTTDANGVPTASGSREQTLGAGSLKAKFTSLINEGTVRVITVGRQNVHDPATNALVVTADNIFLRRALFNTTTGAAIDTGSDLTDAQTKLDNSLGYQTSTNLNSYDSIAAPTDASALAYFLAGADVSATRTAFTVDSATVTTVGFTSDVGNMGWFRQAVSFIAVDTTISLVITPVVTQSDPTLTRRFGMKAIRVTPDGQLVNVTPDEAPVYAIYGLNSDGTQTQIQAGSATATATPSDFYVDVVIPSTYLAVSLKAFAKINGSRTPGGENAITQVGYKFDGTGFMTGLPFK